MGRNRGVVSNEAGLHLSFLILRFIEVSCVLKLNKPIRLEKDLRVYGFYAVHICQLHSGGSAGGSCGHYPEFTPFRPYLYCGVLAKPTPQIKSKRQRKIYKHNSKGPP